MRADESLDNESVLCHDAASRCNGRGFPKAARSRSLGGEGLRISFANRRLSSAVSVMRRCSLIVFSATSRVLLTRKSDSDRPLKSAACWSSALTGGVTRAWSLSERGTACAPDAWLADIGKSNLSLVVVTGCTPRLTGPATAVAWHTTDTAVSDRGQEQRGGGPHPTAVGVGLPCDRSRRLGRTHHHNREAHPLSQAQLLTCASHGTV